MDYLQYLNGTGINSDDKIVKVLNLIINGLPSIQKLGCWLSSGISISVLNLIINGLPSILENIDKVQPAEMKVLNLIINGLPSIPWRIWCERPKHGYGVLNLIINGLPSIPWPNIYTSSVGRTCVLNLIINGLPSIHVLYIL